MIIPVVMAGGAGTRLWPLSRALYPKQLFKLTDGRTMLQSTLQRLDGVRGIAPPVVLCNQSHRFMVAEQIRQIGMPSAVIVLEPVGRNTAPAVTCAALMSMKSTPDPILLVLPADHHIGDVADFHAALKTGAWLAEQRYLVAFGIAPETPETGYGYIRRHETPLWASTTNREHFRPGYRIAEFVEKPDRATAEAYLASGRYYWNSGMFMFRAGRMLDEMTLHAPEIVAACRLAVQKGHADLDFFRLDKTAFASSPADSIDYAVMEKTRHGVMAPLNARWNDLGSWEALWRIDEKDEDGNVIHGDVLVHHVSQSYLHASSRLVAAVGLQNHIVVETGDAVLISPRDRVQEVKHLVEKLQRNNRREVLTHHRDYRPWGSIDLIDEAEGFQIKRLAVKPGGVLSKQQHSHRAEHWIVLRGTAMVTRGGEQFSLKENESTYIPAGICHRLENIGDDTLEMVEVRSGPYLEEDDILRMEDAYGHKDS